MSKRIRINGVLYEEVRPRTAGRRPRRMNESQSFVRNSYGQKLDFEAIVNLMDDDIREQVHDELAPCSDQEFFDRYCELYEEEYGETCPFDTRNFQY